MAQIILSTLNARYIHCSLGLRYLMANLGELQAQAEILEFIIDKRPIDIAEQLLQGSPKIIGFGVYIWNITQTTEVVALLKQISPDTIIVLGGPEVSHEYESQPICSLADYVLSGQADLEFARLCQRLLANEPVANKFIPCLPPKLSDLRFPYDFYTDEDIAHRVIYVEASRGCPFKCEFCLSALDKTAIAFDQAEFLRQLENLFQRGVRQFKFVDRTFNLKVQASINILQFFLQRISKDLFVHFELIPDNLPEKLKQIIQQFPPGALQFEIGIQSFNPEVQQLISRRQNNAKSEANIRWLRQATHAHLHTDLIIGLPGENLQSIANGFNKLVSLNPHEIQVGILKRLKGTPIIRHTENRQMRYNPMPPYNILSTDLIDFATMQRLWRFSRYWDMIANSGRFPNTLPRILTNDPFANFLKLSDWIFHNTEQTHKISLARLYDLLYRGMTESLKINKRVAQDCLLLDYQSSGLKGVPAFLKQSHTPSFKRTGTGNSYTPSRQSRHLKH